MSDLASFVAAAVRDHVVTDLHQEVLQLQNEKQELQNVANRYRELYEQSQQQQQQQQQRNLRQQQHQQPQQQSPFRTISLVLLPPPPPPPPPQPLEEQQQQQQQPQPQPQPQQLPRVLASCRVNLDVALLSGENGGLLTIFAGHADVAVPLRDWPRVQLRIGPNPACLLSELSLRSTLYFTCPATNQSFVKIAMEHGPDLSIEAGIGPVSAEEYRRLFDLPSHPHLPPRNSAEPGGGEEENFPPCGPNNLRVHDAQSRPLSFDRLSDQLLLRENNNGNNIDEDPRNTTKYVKLLFDDCRMSSDFLFEFLDAPYQMNIVDDDNDVHMEEEEDDDDLGMMPVLQQQGGAAAPNGAAAAAAAGGGEIGGDGAADHANGVGGGRG